MIEQCIYSRADNDHVNANHQHVYMGFGRMAWSQGYERLAPYLDQYISSYPNSIRDARSALPPVLAMYEADTPDGRVHALQQIVPLGLNRGRPFHLAHLYAAEGDTSIQGFVANPINWMQTFMLSAHREPVDFPVIQSAVLPQNVKFDPRTLAEVLKYFEFSAANFEMLLCSLFEVSKYDSLCALVLIDDRRENYYDWVRRLIVHIYSFLPLGMRRRIGFESWFTGHMVAGSINLGFASVRSFTRDGGRSYLRTGTGDYYDVTHSAVFLKKGYQCVENEVYPMHFTGTNSYRSFIHSWIARALVPQK